ncbi:MAG: UDP-glucose dehydrogenase family protein [Actinomycetes bacterium]
MTHRITVIGTGYLGATHAAAMAELGHEVLGIDIDAKKIEQLSGGDVPFYEPELPELVRKGLASGALRFGTDPAEAAAFGDVHFVCVGTPQKQGSYAADLTALETATESLAAHLGRPALVVGKSTVPVGTAQRIASRLRALAPAGDGVELAWNPEFLREGHAVKDSLDPDRLVFGVGSPEAEATLRSVYAPVIARGTPVVVADLPTSELVKVAANSFLATKISFINAMAELCEATGADVATLSEALAHDKRIGGDFLRAGLGFGGGCLPKDIRAFMARAGELGVDQALTFLREVDAINQRRRARTVDLARAALGGSFDGRSVTVLGAAFKPGSDDVRDSPALDVAVTIHEQGGRVRVYDPQAMENARARFPLLTYSHDVQSACEGADIVLHLTEWAEFRELDPAQLGEVVAHRRVVDGRGVLDAERWRAAGWTYRALGRP